MFFVRKCCWLLLLLTLVSCGDVMDDLNPSGSDNRTAAEPGTTGPAVGQNAPNFTLADTLGNSVTLSSVFPTVQGVVIYFTMWCPICDTHMSHMQSSQIPSFPNVRFYAVDYVSATVADARNAEISNGFDGSGFTVLADTHQTVLGLYQATMGTTVVIDRAGVVRMNEDYKDGSRLQTVLSGLP